MAVRESLIKAWWRISGPMDDLDILRSRKPKGFRCFLLIFFLSDYIVQEHPKQELEKSALGTRHTVVLSALKSLHFQTPQSSITSLA